MNRAAKIAGRQNGMITFHNAIHSEAPRFHAAASSEGSICDNLSLTMAMAKGAHMTTWEMLTAWSWPDRFRSEEHTSELQSLMRISYAVFCLKKKQHQHAL